MSTASSAPASVLSPGRRGDDIARLTSEELDVLVVGGGVVGAGTALDAVSRGLSTGIVEAQDWAAGTSSRSSKLVHGGLRYLQMLDFGLVRQALRERGLLLTLAPHLVRPLPTLYPLRRPVVERAYVGAGIALYDALAWSGRAGRRLPMHRHLSRRKALELAPGLRRSALVGAVRYYDAQVDDARYVAELVRTAAGRGAVPVSRMAVTGFLRHDGRLGGVEVRDGETGAQHSVRARVTVLATGVWTEDTEALAGNDRFTRVRPSKGSHIVVPRAAIASSVALILRTDRSVLFVLPWGEHWLIGTTDTDWSYERGRPVATAHDVDYLLGELNGLLARPVARQQVEAVYAGLRPLVAGVGVVRGPGEAGGGRRPRAEDGRAETTRISREHAVGHPAPGLVAVSGGKYTTYRVMAKDAVDAAVTDGGFQEAPPSSTDEIPLLGARGFEALWARRRATAHLAGLPVATVERLLLRYGGLSEDLLAAIKADPSLGAPVTGTGGYTRAELAYAVTHEGARHLDDVLVRRARAAMETSDGGASAAREVADLVGPLLGWDDATKAAEVDDYRRQARLVQEAAQAPSDEGAAQLVEATPTLLPLP